MARQVARCADRRRPDLRARPQFLDDLAIIDIVHSRAELGHEPHEVARYLCRRAAEEVRGAARTALSKRRRQPRIFCSTWRRAIEVALM